jgi:Putative peptidoglycan binding domain
MSKFPKRKRGRVIASMLLIVTVATVAAVVWRRQPAETVVQAASILKSATVTTGDMTTTERIDGTVELSSTLTVLHRIEGQTSTTSTAAASDSNTPATDSVPSNLSSSLVSTASASLLDDCTTTDPAATTEPVAAAPAGLVAVATTEAVAVATTEPTTTDPVSPDAPPDTTPVAITTPAPSTTVPADATCTTTPSTTPAGPDGARPTGALPSGSPTGSGGGGPTATTEVTQTITSIMAVNAQPRRGDVLYSVDGSPVIALDGALPAWRSISTSSDDGADIAQLEASLVALGYDPDAKVTVDNEFDSATKTMVKLWQEGLGVEQTGEVELGSIVFLPSATTVTAVEREVGDSVGEGDAVLQLAASTQDVVIEVPEDDQALVVPGLAVKVGDLQGTVAELRSADSDGSVVVEAVVIPASEIEGATNGSTVKVTLTLENAKSVLLVPAEALVSRIDGTYAVQLETTDETTKWLAVEVIGVSGSSVAIRGDGLTEGTAVLLPV